MTGKRRNSPRSKKRFLYIPVEVLKSEACRTLPPSALKVLCCLGAQFSGFNNGDMAIARPITAEFGMRSRRQITDGAKLLEGRGLIIKTRQGGNNRCNLYAVTWHAIDYCKGKLEVPETKVAGNEWKKWKPEKSE